MKIFILRHGKAEAMEVGHTDKHRCLSAKGKQQLSSVANWMNQHHYRPQLILSSPYKRCRETAEIIQKNLIQDGSDASQVIPIQFEDCLIYGADPMLAFSLITSLDVESVLLSSHMPLVSELAHLFAPGAMNSGFKTAEIVKIRYDLESQHGVVTANITANEI